jgi:hypothetical protein
VCVRVCDGVCGPRLTVLIQRRVSTQFGFGFTAARYRRLVFHLEEEEAARRPVVVVVGPAAGRGRVASANDRQRRHVAAVGVGEGCARRRPQSAD